MSIVAPETVRIRSAEFSAEWIRHGVQLRTHGRVQNLAVIVLGGVVYLKGTCAKYHTKQLASVGALDACAAFDASERIQVHNGIEVY